MIIAIDGPAGSGKSTVAKMLAKELGFTYIDTGAMYRAFAYKIKKLSVNPDNQEEVVDLLKDTDIKLQGESVYVDSEEVSSYIRTEEIGNIASKVARYKEVRRFMVKKQREIGLSVKNAVIEGRDTGSVIFPDADLKIFMTASPEIRAKRRVEQLREKGFTVDYNHILEKIKERDRMDYEREESPLKPTPDYVIIDTTEKEINEVINYIKRLIQEKVI